MFLLVFLLLLFASLSLAAPLINLIPTQRSQPGLQEIATFVQINQWNCQRQLQIGLTAVLLDSLSSEPFHNYSFYNDSSKIGIYNYGLFL